MPVNYDTIEDLCAKQKITCFIRILIQNCVIFAFYQCDLCVKNIITSFHFWVQFGINLGLLLKSQYSACLCRLEWQVFCNMENIEKSGKLSTKRKTLFFATQNKNIKENHCV